VVDLAVVPARAVGFFKVRTGTLCSAAKAFTSRRKRFPIFSSSAGEGREAEVLCEEGDHLTADLQIGDVSIEQQPVDTVDLQADVTVQHLVDVHRVRHERRDSA